MLKIFIKICNIKLFLSQLILSDKQNDQSFIHQLQIKNEILLEVSSYNPAITYIFQREQTVFLKLFRKLRCGQKIITCITIKVFASIQ